jgi:hypothetical protein
MSVALQYCSTKKEKIYLGVGNMMKQLLSFLFVVILVLGFSLQTHAELFNRGTDSLGNRLIYDNDLNITWYDYSNPETTWQNHLNWASALTVNFGETIYDDWRLPTTVDGPWVLGYDGTTTAGWNITNSEMGHLFYAELGNKGAYDTSGNFTGSTMFCSGNVPYCLTNTGDFQNLLLDMYRSGTESAANSDYAWFLDFRDGMQDSRLDKLYCCANAIAVHPGDVTVVPEPVSFILFLTGSASLIVRHFLKKRML